METDIVGGYNDHFGVLRSLADLEAQSYKMKTELFRYFKNPLYWIVYGAGISIRTVLAYFDSLHRKKSSGNWPKIFGARLDRQLWAF